MPKEFKLSDVVCWFWSACEKKNLEKILKTRSSLVVWQIIPGLEKMFVLQKYFKFSLKIIFWMQRNSKYFRKFEKWKKLSSWKIFYQPCHLQPPRTQFHFSNKPTRKRKITENKKCKPRDVKPIVITRIMIWISLSVIACWWMSVQKKN